MIPYLSNGDVLTPELINKIIHSSNKQFVRIAGSDSAETLDLRDRACALIIVQLEGVSSLEVIGAPDGTMIVMFFKSIAFEPVLVSGVPRYASDEDSYELFPNGVFIGSVKADGFWDVHCPPTTQPVARPNVDDPILINQSGGLTPSNGAVYKLFGQSVTVTLSTASNGKVAYFEAQHATLQTPHKLAVIADGKEYILSQGNQNDYAQSSAVAIAVKNKWVVIGGIKKFAIDPNSIDGEHIVSGAITGGHLSQSIAPSSVVTVGGNFTPIAGNYIIGNGGDSKVIQVGFNSNLEENSIIRIMLDPAEFFDWVAIEFKGLTNHTIENNIVRVYLKRSSTVHPPSSGVMLTKLSNGYAFCGGC